MIIGDRALIFSDLHLGLNRDNEIFYKVSLDFADWLSSEASSRDIKTIIFCGDFFHNRKNISLETLGVAFKFMDKLKDYKVFMITGNHDCLYSDNSTVSSVALFKNWPNVHVMDTSQYFEVGGKVVGFIPWGNKCSKPCDYMFGHFEITGFQMNGSHFCKKGMTATSLLSKSPLVISGHFHKPQTNVYKKGKICYLGSAFQNDWGESGQDKFIYEIEFSSGKFLDIENTISPKHIHLKNADDLHKAKSNFVKLHSFEGIDIDVEEIKKVCLNIDIVYDDIDPVLEDRDMKDFNSVSIIDAIRECAMELDGDADIRDMTFKKCKDIYESV